MHTLYYMHYIKCFANWVYHSVPAGIWTGFAGVTSRRPIKPSGPTVFNIILTKCELWTEFVQKFAIFLDFLNFFSKLIAKFLQNIYKNVFKNFLSFLHNFLKNFPTNCSEYSCNFIENFPSNFVQNFLTVFLSLLQIFALDMYY